MPTSTYRRARAPRQVDASQLLKQKLRPPFVPKVKDDMDTSNFDHYDDVPDQPYVDDGTGWDKDF